MAYLLVVDDDEDFAFATATALRADGHEVGISLETKGALASIAERPPDMVILDVMFPENPAGGFELARHLRELPGKPQAIPVLMLTAVNSRFPLGFGKHDIDGEWLPVTEFLEKPVDLTALQLQVRSMLEKAQA